MLLLAVCGAAQAGEVTLQRDLWGVPHLFAATLPDAAYGLGYAQAEDRLEQLCTNYRLALGRMAEVAGPDYVEHDWQQRLAGHEEVCRRRYPTLSADVRAVCEAYTAGVRAFVAAHPERRTETFLEPEPWMIPALGRLIIFGWPMGEAMTELGRRTADQPFSNQWAVRPERTADGGAFLLTDPHIPWDGPFRFYEFRLHAGGVDASGFGPLGAPMIGLGHNAYLGWACTTGGPDTTDVYVERLDPENPHRYRYDAEWRNLSSQQITIKVRGAAAVTRPIERSHHGPIVLREPGKAYAVACPYFDQIGAVEQLFRMMTSRNLAEFNRALALCQLMPQNVMMADVEGNIQYVRTGRVPIRPPGFDFSRPVPGNTSRSEWLGIHPAGDLIQVLNPPTGYLQNCNIAPDTMATGLQFDVQAYPGYLFNDTPGRTTSRGRRAVELLDANPHLTLDQAKALVFDTHADQCEPWLAAVRQAAAAIDLDEAFGDGAAALRSTVAGLAAWDGFMSQDSMPATWYRGLRLFAQQEKLRVTGQPLDAQAQRRLLRCLANCLKALHDKFGTIDVTYGQVLRLRRGDRSWPLSGGESGGGQTLRAISAGMEDGVWSGHGGQNWVQLIQFKPGAVRSWTVTPYGQSDDPQSPHFTDQAEQLFSPGKLKPTWFQPAELEGHIESTETLTYEP